MGHYAKVAKGKVTQVRVAEPEFINTFVDSSPGKWLKCSYNTRGGVYYNPNSNTPASDQSVINDDEGRKRKNYPGIGSIYDETKDAFYRSKPHDSWTLNDSTCLWGAPKAMPDDGKPYSWNESKGDWEAIT